VAEIGHHQGGVEFHEIGFISGCCHHQSTGSTCSIFVSRVEWMTREIGRVLTNKDKVGHVVDKR
jgi:hypothetical protein